MEEMTNAGMERNKLALLSKPEVWRVSTVKLLIALILLFAVTPFVEDLPNGDFVESGLVTLVMVASLIAVARRPRVLMAAAVLIVPAIAGKWLNYFFPNHVFVHCFFGFRNRLFRFHHLPYSSLHSPNYECRYRGTQRRHCRLLDVGTDLVAGLYVTRTART